MTVALKKVEGYQSKWGFHACDYETFRKLKALHKAYWKAVYDLGKWFRWQAKMPHNRVLKQRIKDDSGRVIGWKELGPWPEPTYLPIFGCPSYRRDFMTVPQHLNDRGIVAAYQNARMPKSANEVVPLNISLEEIDTLYRALSE
jgi:hypothetical protein